MCPGTPARAPTSSGRSCSRSCSSCATPSTLALTLYQVECVLANLIYAGYIKGYISHQHGKLVVSKGNAFPELSAVQGGK